MDVSVRTGKNGSRVLTAQVLGAEHARPVFLMHGTPGSRLGPCPRVQVLYRLGVRLITYDRPGYGGSERNQGRNVAAAAADVAAIADHLGLDRFAVVGRSGGGPHALACAARLPDRVTRAAVLVGLAPRDAEGLDWLAGMTPSNVSAFLAAESARHELADRLESHADRIRDDPAVHLPFGDPELPVSDRRVVADFGLRALMVENFAEAVRDSGAGWLDDVLAFSRPWGFQAADAGAVPVLLWHGADDVFSPVGHTLWLAGSIPGATLIVEPGQAHFGAMSVLPQVLRWVTATHQRAWLNAAA